MSGPSYAGRKALRAALLSGAVPEWLLRHPRRPYIVQAVLASPPWVQRKDFNPLVAKRDALTQRTGVPHTLDHEIPLNHPRVCGLNVPWNIQVLTKAANARKSNAWCEWHGDLFSEPEQFTLF